jgi:cytochrome c peroxidase
VPNSPPVVANGNRPQLVKANAPLQLDASQGGTTFTDADGDAMSYAVSLRGDPQGLVASGTQVSGRLDRVGAVEVTITARDDYGGVGSDSFLIAVAAAESSRVPTLPATPYVYRDEELPLPDMYRTSSESIVPLWDTQPPDNRTTNAGAALGRVLFYDTRLSITNTVACGSCHEQARGFATSRRFDKGVLGLPLPRNSMALANSRYSIHNSWFGDMRVHGDLRNLIFVPIDNHDEQGMALFAVEAKLKDVGFYPPLFAAAFGTPEITRERIAAALAQFVQSLIAYRSKSDRAENPMENVPFTPEAVYSAQEMRGRDLFTPRCGLCHEVHAGTNVWQANNGLDVVPSDTGTQDPALRRNGSLGVFRAASLRNVAVSAPYMHDGRFGTLREVIDHYDHGLQDSPHLDGILRDVFGAPVRFNFSEEDKVALEAFLNTMTDVEFLSDPKFSDPFAP